MISDRKSLLSTISTSHGLIVYSLFSSRELVDDGGIRPLIYDISARFTRQQSFGRVVCVHAMSTYARCLEQGIETEYVLL